MPRDSRRRSSPESSRRRRAERRASREQLAAVAPMPMPQQQQQYSPSPSYAPPSAQQPYPPAVQGYAPSTASYPHPPYPLSYPPPPSTMPPQRTRAGSSSSSNNTSTSSTSSSLLNISRKSRFGIRSFFTSSSRTRRSSKKRARQRAFRKNNSSSSSVDSDLAYGHGYIPKTAVSSPMPGHVVPGQRPLTRRQTDEEILELGRQLSVYARAQNEQDLKRLGRVRPSTLVAGAAAVGALSRRNSGREKGVGGSKLDGRGDESPDDEDWESASDDDDESSSDGYDGGLAYGSVPKFSDTHLPPKQTYAASVVPESVVTAAPTIISQPPPEDIRPPNRKRSAVDPAMFGPVNSLRGYVNTPCGFRPGETHSGVAQIGYGAQQRRDSASNEANRPMRVVYPVPTSDPNRFETTGTVVTGYSQQESPSLVSRPAPLPIQAPKPIGPDKFRVLEGREEERYRDEKRKSGGSRFAGAALAGVAAAAIGKTVLSNREKREREERESEKAKEARRTEDERRRRAEEDRQREEEARRREEDRLREKEARRLEVESVIALQREKEARRIVEEREKEARRLSEERALAEAQLEKRRQYAAQAKSGGKDIIIEDRRSEQDKKRDAPKSKDKGKQVARNDVLIVDDKKADEARRAARKAEKAARKAKEAEERRLELERVKAEIERLKGGEPLATYRYDDGEASSSAGPSRPRHIDMPPVDPFQFQVEDDAFQTPRYSATPQIVAVEREPKWDDEDEVVTLDPPERERMSRKDSYEHELAVRELAEARAIHQEAEETTYPVDIGTAATAIAVVHAVEASKRGPREAEPNRDPIKEADEWYREKKLSERLQREEMRSRSASPEPSVLDKYDIVEEPQQRIPTPPAMAKNKNKFDSPNADVRIDNEIWPHQLERFRYPPGSSLGGAGPPIWVSRDPSCERERPVLNIVRPTPTPSPAPSEDRKRDRSVSPTREKGKERERSKSPSPNVRMGPRGEIIPETGAQPETKSVTWGKNDTKHYDPDHKTSGEEEKATRAEKIREIVYGKGKKKSALTGLAAALAAAAGAESVHNGAIAGDKTDGTSGASGKEVEPQPVIERGRCRSRSRSPVSGTRGRSKSPLPSESVIARGRSRSRSPLPQPHEGRERSKSPLPGSFGHERSGSPPAPATERGRSRSPLPQRRERSKSPMPRSLHDTQLYEDHDEPPTPGPKPDVSPESSHMPGAFDDDIDFAATIAAGLQSSGFDPNIVIEDPFYSRRDSPPGSNIPEHGFVLGEVPETPTSEKGLEEPPYEVVEPKISNKERKRREKAARLAALEKETEVKVEPELQEEIRSVVAAGEFASKHARDEDEPVLDDTEEKPRKSSSRDADPTPSNERFSSSPVEEDNREETPKKSKKTSKRDSAYETYDSPSRDVTPSEVSVETASSGKRGKKSRRSTKDSYDVQPDEEDPPGRRRRRREKDLDDRDVSSVVSAPSRYDRRSNGDHDDAKSAVSEKASGKRSSGFFGMFKGNGNSEERKERQKDNKDNKQSFLGKAGTLGEGAGLAGAALALMGLTTSSRSNAADDVPDEPSATRSSDSPQPSSPVAGQPHTPSQTGNVTPTGRPRSTSLGSHDVDPEIIQRQIKPAIDPQYGDLLPLPPSEPGTPKFEVDDVETLPSLPESRPNTPPTLDVKKTHVRRRSAFETPTKSPSQTAIPIHFRIGQRSMPSSPNMARASPVMPPSPGFASSTRDTVGGGGNRSRPNSWGREMLGEIKPLYLVEKTSSTILGKDADERQEYPELPPSGPPSRVSPAPDFEGRHGHVEYFTPSAEPAHGLTLDTAVAAALGGSEPLGSAELTPRAQWTDQDEYSLHSPKTGGNDAGDEFPLASVGSESVDDFHSAAQSMHNSPDLGEDVLAEWPEMGSMRRRSGSDASSVVVEFHRRRREGDKRDRVADSTQLPSLTDFPTEESHAVLGGERPKSPDVVSKEVDQTETIPERWISDFTYEGFAQLPPLPESTGSSLVEEPLHGDIAGEEHGPSEPDTVADMRDLALLPPLPPSTGTSLVDEPMAGGAAKEGHLTTPIEEKPEPVAKDRSSHLLYQTPSTTKAVASFETARDNTPPSPPRKHDDLDIAAGVAAGVFDTGVVAALLHDSASKDVGLESVEQEKPESPTGSMHSAEELLTPDEMSMTGQGKKKNKKKGRKSMGKEVDSLVERELASEALSTREEPLVTAERVSAAEVEEVPAHAQDEPVNVAEEAISSHEEKTPAAIQEQDVTPADQLVAHAKEAEVVPSELQEIAPPTSAEDEKHDQHRVDEPPSAQDREPAPAERMILSSIEEEKPFDLEQEMLAAAEAAGISQDQADEPIESTTSSSKKSKKKKKKGKPTSDIELEQPIVPTPSEALMEAVDNSADSVAEPEPSSTLHAPQEDAVLEAPVERDIASEELEMAVQTQLPLSVSSTRPTSPVPADDPVEVAGTDIPPVVVEETAGVQEASTLTAEEAEEIAKEEAAIAALKTKKAKNKKKKLNKTDQAELNRLEERARLRDEARAKQTPDIKPEPAVGEDKESSQAIAETGASMAEPLAAEDEQPVTEVEHLAADAPALDAAVESSTLEERLGPHSTTPILPAVTIEQQKPDEHVVSQEPAVHAEAIETTEPQGAQITDTELAIAAQTELPGPVKSTRPSSPVQYQMEDVSSSSDSPKKGREQAAEQEPDVSDLVPEESAAAPEPSTAREIPADEIEPPRPGPDTPAGELGQTILPGEAIAVEPQIQDESSSVTGSPANLENQDKELELAAGSQLPVSQESTRPSSPIQEATASSTAEGHTPEVLPEIAEEEAAIAALKARKARNKKKKLNKTDQAELNRLEERARQRREAIVALAPQIAAQVPSLEQEQTLVAESVPETKEEEPITTEPVTTKEEAFNVELGSQEDKEPKQPPAESKLSVVEVEQPTAGSEPSTPSNTVDTVAETQPEEHKELESAPVAEPHERELQSAADTPLPRSLDTTRPASPTQEAVETVSDIAADIAKEEAVIAALKAKKAKNKKKKLNKTDQAELNRLEEKARLRALQSEPTISATEPEATTVETEQVEGAKEKPEHDVTVPDAMSGVQPEDVEVAEPSTTDGNAHNQVDLPGQAEPSAPIVAEEKPTTDEPVAQADLDTTSQHLKTNELPVETPISDDALDLAAKIQLPGSLAGSRPPSPPPITGAESEAPTLDESVSSASSKKSKKKKKKGKQTTESEPQTSTAEIADADEAAAVPPTKATLDDQTRVDQMPHTTKQGETTNKERELELAAGTQLPASAENTRPSTPVPAEQPVQPNIQQVDEQGSAPATPSLEESVTDGSSNKKKKKKKSKQADDAQVEPQTATAGLPAVEAGIGTDLELPPASEGQAIPTDQAAVSVRGQPVTEAVPPALEHSESLPAEGGDTVITVAEPLTQHLEQQTTDALTADADNTASTIAQPSNSQAVPITDPPSSSQLPPTDELERDRNPEQDRAIQSPEVLAEIAEEEAAIAALKKKKASNKRKKLNKTDQAELNRLEEKARLREAVRAATVPAEPPTLDEQQTLVAEPLVESNEEKSQAVVEEVPKDESTQSGRVTPILPESQVNDVSDAAKTEVQSRDLQVEEQSAPDPEETVTATKPQTAAQDPQSPTGDVPSGIIHEETLVDTEAAIATAGMNQDGSGKNVEPEFSVTERASKKSKKKKTKKGQLSNLEESSTPPESPSGTQSGVITPVEPSVEVTERSPPTTANLSLAPGSDNATMLDETTEQAVKAPEEVPPEITAEPVSLGDKVIDTKDHSEIPAATEDVISEESRIPATVQKSASEPTDANQAIAHNITFPVTEESTATVSSDSASIEPELKVLVEEPETKKDKKKKKKGKNAQVIETEGDSSSTIPGTPAEPSETTMTLESQPTQDDPSMTPTMEADLSINASTPTPGFEEQEFVTPFEEATSATAMEFVTPFEGRGALDVEAPPVEPTVPVQDVVATITEPADASPAGPNTPLGDAIKPFLPEQNLESVDDLALLEAADSVIRSAREHDEAAEVAEEEAALALLRAKKAKLKKKKKLSKKDQDELDRLENRAKLREEAKALREAEAVASLAARTSQPDASSKPTETVDVEQLVPGALPETPALEAPEQPPGASTEQVAMNSSSKDKGEFSGEAPTADVEAMPEQLAKEEAESTSKGGLLPAALSVLPAVGVVGSLLGLASKQEPEEPEAEIVEQHTSSVGQDTLSKQEVEDLPAPANQGTHDPSSVGSQPPAEPQLGEASGQGPDLGGPTADTSANESPEDTTTGAIVDTAVSVPDESTTVATAIRDSDGQDTVKDNKSDAPATLPQDVSPSINEQQPVAIDEAPSETTDWADESSSGQKMAKKGKKGKVKAKDVALDPPTAPEETPPPIGTVDDTEEVEPSQQEVNVEDVPGSANESTTEQAVEVTPDDEWAAPTTKKGKKAKKSKQKAQAAVEDPDPEPVSPEVAAASEEPQAPDVSSQDQTVSAPEAVQDEVPGDRLPSDSPPVTKQPQEPVSVPEEPKEVDATPGEAQDEPAVEDTSPEATKKLSKKERRKLKQTAQDSSADVSAAEPPEAANEEPPTGDASKDVPEAPDKPAEELATPAIDIAETNLEETNNDSSTAGPNGDKEQPVKTPEPEPPAVVEAVDAESAPPVEKPSEPLVSEEVAAVPTIATPEAGDNLGTPAAETPEALADESVAVQSQEPESSSADNQPVETSAEDVAAEPVAAGKKKKNKKKKKASGTITPTVEEAAASTEEPVVENAQANAPEAAEAPQVAESTAGDPADIPAAEAADAPTKELIPASEDISKELEGSTTAEPSAAPTTEPSTDATASEVLHQEVREASATHNDSPPEDQSTDRETDTSKGLLPAALSILPSVAAVGNLLGLHTGEPTAATETDKRNESSALPEKPTELVLADQIEPTPSDEPTEEPSVQEPVTEKAPEPLPESEKVEVAEVQEAAQPVPAEELESKQPAEATAEDSSESPVSGKKKKKNKKGKKTSGNQEPSSTVNPPTVETPPTEQPTTEPSLPEEASHEPQQPQEAKLEESNLPDVADQPAVGVSEETPRSPVVTQPPESTADAPPDVPADQSGEVVPDAQEVAAMAEPNTRLELPTSARAPVKRKSIADLIARFEQPAVDEPPKTSRKDDTKVNEEIAMDAAQAISSNAEELPVSTTVDGKDMEGTVTAALEQETITEGPQDPSAEPTVQETTNEEVVTVPEAADPVTEPNASVTGTVTEDRPEVTGVASQDSSALPAEEKTPVQVAESTAEPSEAAAEVKKTDDSTPELAETTTQSELAGDSLESKELSAGEDVAVQDFAAADSKETAEVDHPLTVPSVIVQESPQPTPTESQEGKQDHTSAGDSASVTTFITAHEGVESFDKSPSPTTEPTPLEEAPQEKPLEEDTSAPPSTSPYTVSLRNSRERRKQSPGAETRQRAPSPSSSTGVVVMGQEARKPDEEEEDSNADAPTSLTSTTLKRSKKDRKRSGSQTKQNSEDSESPSGLTLSEDSWTTPPIPVTQLSTIMEGSIEDLAETDNTRGVDTVEGGTQPEDTLEKSRGLRDVEDGNITATKTDSNDTAANAQLVDTAQSTASDTPVDTMSEERELNVSTTLVDVPSTEDSSSTGKKGKKGKKAKKNKKTALPWDEPKPAVGTDSQAEITTHRSKEPGADVYQRTTAATVPQTDSKELVEEGPATTAPEDSNVPGLPAESEVPVILADPLARPVEEHQVTDAVISQIDQLEALPVDTLPSTALQAEVETPSLETPADLASSDDKPSDEVPSESVKTTDASSKEPGESQAHDEWALPSKKSKKDKKKKAKKGASTPVQSEDQVHPDTVEAQPAESSSQEGAAIPASSADVPEPRQDTTEDQALQTPDSQPQETEEESAPQAKKLAASLAEPEQQPQAVVEELATEAAAQDDRIPVTTTTESLSKVLEDIAASQKPEPGSSEEAKEVIAQSWEQLPDQTPVTRAATPEISTAPITDEAIQVTEPAEPITETAAAEDEWALPVKKSKKDKKKKKKGKAVELAESDTVSGTSTPTAEDAPSEAIEPVKTREQEPPASEETKASDAVEEAPVPKPDVPEYFKDAPGDASETLQSQAEVLAPSQEKAEARDVAEESSEHVREEAELPSNNVPDAPPKSEAQALNPEQPITSMGGLPVTDAILSQIDNLEALPTQDVLPIAQFEEPPTPQVELPVEAATEPTTAVPPESLHQDRETQDVDEWALPEKKSKKSKKKNKKGSKASDSTPQSGIQTPTVDEPLSSVSVEEPAEPTVIAEEAALVDIEAPTTEGPAIEAPAPPLDVPQMAEQQTEPTIETVKDAAVSEAAQDADATSVTEQTMPVPDANLVVGPSQESPPSNDPQADAPAEPDTTAAPETQAEEFWALPSKKSKKDKKKKGKQSTSATDSGDATPTVQEDINNRELETTRAEPSAAIAAQDTQADDEGPEAPAKKSKKDKKRKGKQIAEALAGAATAAVSVIPSVAELHSDEEGTEHRAIVEQTPVELDKEVAEPGLQAEAALQETTEKTAADNNVLPPAASPTEPAAAATGQEPPAKAAREEPSQHVTESTHRDIEPESVWGALVKKGKEGQKGKQQDSEAESIQGRDVSVSDAHPGDNDTFEINPVALGFTKPSPDQGLKALLPGIETVNLANTEHLVLPPVNLPSPELLTGSPPPKELLAPPLDATLAPAQETSTTVCDVAVEHSDTSKVTKINDDYHVVNTEITKSGDEIVNEETVEAPPIEEPMPTETKPEPSARDIAASYLEEQTTQPAPVTEQPMVAEAKPKPSPREIAAQILEKPGAIGSSKPEEEPVSEVREIAATWLENKTTPAGQPTEEEQTEDVRDEPQAGVSSISKQDGHDNEKAVKAATAAGGVALLAHNLDEGSGTSAGKVEKEVQEPLKEPESTNALEQEPAITKEKGKDTDLEDDESGDKNTAVVKAEAATKEVPRLKEVARLAHDDADVDSPILGRPDSDKRKTVAAKDDKPPVPVQEPFSFPEDVAEDEIDTPAEDTVGSRGTDLHEDEPHDSPGRSIPYMSSIPDLRRSLISLPPVQEEEVEEEQVKDHQQTLLRTPEVNRDSGFISDSVTPRRRSHRYDDDSHRDSGVHLRDWPESTSPHTSKRDLEAHPATSSHKAETHSYHQETSRSEARPTSSIETPEVQRVSGSRGLAQTPKLKEPLPPPTTPEPQKLSVKKRTATKQLDREPEPAARNVGAPLTVPSPAPSERRVVSDNSALYHKGEPLRRSPASSDLSLAARRSASNTSMSRLRTPEPLNLRPDSPGSVRSLHSATPPLRRNRISGDLRAVSLSQRSLSELSASSPATPATNKGKGDSDKKEAATAGAALSAGVAAGAAALALASHSSRASASTTPVANEGRVRSKDMADVYDGYGEGRIGSPRSPTRPHSMRRRQSMQVLDLENKVRELEAENLALSESRNVLQHMTNQRTSSALAERDATIGQLKQNLAFLQKEVERLTEVNEGLNSANAQIAVTHTERYRDLESKYAIAIRELEQARSQTSVLHEKDAEIAKLRVQLEEAKQKIRTMQDQILESTPGTDAPDYLRVKDVDHFDHRCQQLCNHVQQWVLRFSKFSDMRACRLTSEINDEKIIDRLDNAVLDGSDVDTYLNDRVRRRDIFMSMTMTMIWEFVFTRYLFGMDREQRQKLKSLEKVLLEVGPPHAVRQWRAITLTLLSRRPQFKQQRDTDTEAVVQAIFQTLSVILPPPTNMEDQIQSQLRKVMREAVDLAVEMRTQRAEYMMLPPLQPEYDDTGELTETVSFNAALMNERSDSGTSNEDWEAAHAIVRIVLFPLVVKKGDDSGVGDDEIVVSPAQVLVAKPEKRRTIRMVTPSSDAGGASLISRSERMSTASLAGTTRHANGSDVRMGDAPYS